ncbi:MAG TPA: hypothetical protein VEI04_09260 [Syntrophobacteria bacterium]|nr:hypothetical protein [Syntrophobacteria bacterium]
MDQTFSAGRGCVSCGADPVQAERTAKSSQGEMQRAMNSGKRTGIVRL